ncbi:YtfJ family protein [Parasalinivibrio latis]|uniref:YtfJ family protein n=1 Tax=Parasalinivibrio latis TaxID=2952610 RepID=UPI0030E5697C
MNKKLTLALTLAALPWIAQAHNLTVGQPVPAVKVDDKGELMLTDGSITYQPWSAAQLPGKVRVVQAMAGRSSAKEINGPIIEALKTAGLPKDTYQTTTIVNQDDAVWGTGGFVKSSVEDSKEEFSWSSFILDADGKVAKAWDLKAKSNAIIVLDKSGKVLFAKDGALTEQEISDVLSMLKTALQ